MQKNSRRQPDSLLKKACGDMIYLLLSLILACLTYLVYKIADAEHYDSDSITLYNYVVAAALAITNAILHSQYEIFQYVLQGNLWTLTTVKSLSNTAVILVVIGVLSGVFLRSIFFRRKTALPPTEQESLHFLSRQVSLAVCLLLFCFLASVHQACSGSA